MNNEQDRPMNIAHCFIIANVSAMLGPLLGTVFEFRSFTTVIVMGVCIWVSAFTLSCFVMRDSQREWRKRNGEPQ